MEILISNRQASQPIDFKALKSRTLRILGALDCVEASELSLVLTDDPGIAVLNQDYLGRVGPTNVLAFPMGEGQFAELNPGILGDVVISVDTAWREAFTNGLNPGEHLVRLLIHGILHLLGHDHLAGAEQARAMEELTERLLKQSAG
ncbi:Endoribonuclease YbeY [Desulfarculales bacterium]